MGGSTAPGHPDIARLVAPNPGPLTLEGTNTYIVGENPADVIDPGPDDPGHIGRVREEVERRGGLGGVLLTHSHSDHSAGAARLGGELLWGSPGDGDEEAALTAALAQAAGPAVGERGASPATFELPRAGPSPELDPEASAAALRTKLPAAEQHAGPFTVIATPGHASDHVCFLLDDTCFCGDLILGEGSSIVPPAAGGGSLRDYMFSLSQLADLDLTLLCPGHGPWIANPAEKIAEYVRHRGERESKLIAALDAGELSRSKLLEEAWDDVPVQLRAAAVLAMQAHLEKVAADGRDLGGLRD